TSAGSISGVRLTRRGRWNREPRGADASLLRGARWIPRQERDRRRGRFRSTMALKAILFDLGDVIMREETEQKVDGVTQRAELVPGMADLLRDLKGEGKRLGLVADTREGTYLNVLRQHALYDLFDAFAISDLLGAEKPDRRMFAHALAGLGIPAEDWQDVAMVG